MPAIYELTKCEESLDAFCDPAVLVDLLRVYNIKRNFCGQDRLDAMSFCGIFKNPTDYEDGPVLEDVNQDASPREADGFVPFMVAMRSEIQTTVDAEKIDIPDVYSWVKYDTGDPFEYPEEWHEFLEEEIKEDTAHWHKHLTAMIDTVNLLLRMDPVTVIVQKNTINQTIHTMDLITVPMRLKYQSQAVYAVPADGYDNPTHIGTGWWYVWGGVSYVPSYFAYGRQYYTVKALDSVMAEDVRFERYALPNQAPRIVNTQFGVENDIYEHNGTWGFKPAITTNMTASNMYDVIASQTFQRTDTFGSDVEVSSVEGICTLYADTHNAVKYYARNQWHPGSGWLTNTMPSATACTQGIRIKNANGLGIRIKIPLYVSLNYFERNRVDLKNTTYPAIPSITMGATLDGEDQVTITEEMLSGTGQNGWYSYSTIATWEIYPESDDHTSLLRCAIAFPTLSGLYNAMIPSEFIETVTDGGVLTTGFRDTIYIQKRINPEVDDPIPPGNRAKWGGIMLAYDSSEKIDFLHSYTIKVNVSPSDGGDDRSLAIRKESRPSRARVFSLRFWPGSRTWEII